MAAKTPITDLVAAASQVEEQLRAAGIRMTLGGEPTYLPVDPKGDEWNTTAVGPEKLSSARRLAESLVRHDLPTAIMLFSPGKCYPGETNPRWMLHIAWRRDGRRILNRRPSGRRGPLVAAASAGADDRQGIVRFNTGDRAALEQVQGTICRQLGVSNRWSPAIDPSEKRGALIGILLLEEEDGKWSTFEWRPRPARGRLKLVATDGPAGLRLPLASLDPSVPRRALVIERRPNGAWHAFLPPLSCMASERLMRVVADAFAEQQMAAPNFDGYLPFDHGDRWIKLSLSPDPGVLEVNLPPCESWHEYHDWLALLDERARETGLVPYRMLPSGRRDCTGGGNHLLFGGPRLDANPFFRRPGLVASMCRYFQHHPSLAYLFTGRYVGRASQAPRADESTTALEDLEMAYRTLEAKENEPGDHRWLICETLRNLHTDDAGSSHRSELSFDKFWLEGGPPGSCSGLIEFRALASMPEPWMNSAAALLFRAIVCRLLREPFDRPLVDFGKDLHDRYFLPSFVRDDLQRILSDLTARGVRLPARPFMRIWEWQFPLLLRWRHSHGILTVRRAHESWPLVGDAPTVGGTTSRFVDTSMTRIEIAATPAFVARHRILVSGREITLRKRNARECIAGLRFRSSALYPCLHPALPVNHPIELRVESRRGRQLGAWILDSDEAECFTEREQESTAIGGTGHASPCRTPWEDAFTFDLRIP